MHFVQKHLKDIHARYKGITPFVAKRAGTGVVKYVEKNPAAPADGQFIEVFSTILEMKKLDKTKISPAMRKALPAAMADMIDQFDDVLEVYGYASTSAIDQAGDIVSNEALKGCIDDWMEWGNIRLQHDSKAPPVGKCFASEVDEKGLYIGCLIVGKQVIEQVMLGSLSGFSIGFWPLEYHTEEIPLDTPEDLGGGYQRTTQTVWVFDKIKLIEISLVDRPCNPEAKVDNLVLHQKGVTSDMTDEQKKALAEFLKSIGVPSAPKDGDAEASPKPETDLTEVHKTLSEIVKTVNTQQTTVDTLAEKAKGDDAKISELSKQLGDVSAAIVKITEIVKTVSEEIKKANTEVQDTLETPNPDSSVEEKTVSFAEAKDVEFTCGGKKYSIKKELAADPTGLGEALMNKDSQFGQAYMRAKAVFMSQLSKEGGVI